MTTSIDWPLTLPQRPLARGNSGKQRSTTIRTPNATGPDKVRRRSSLKLSDVPPKYVLTLVQLNILRDFFDDDCEGGSLSFNWPFPPNYTSAEVRFKDEYTWNQIGRDSYSVTLEIEEI